MHVLIAGAGPTGLMLAGDLAEAGVQVTVLERRTSESNMTRAFGVHARTLEELDMRGLADKLPGQTVQRLRLFDRVQVDLSVLPSRFNHLLITPQYEVEKVLLERADRLGVKIELGAEVVGLTQDKDGVTVEIRDEHGETSTRTGQYLVGADGVHSKVRQLLGLPFPGKAVVKSIMLADVRLTELPEDVLRVNAVGDGFTFVAPFGDGWYRVFAWDRRHQVDDKAPLELDEIRAVTKRALGTDMGMHDPRWMSRFHSDERQVPKYRVGRVFLAGDAAHCHSPAGGQGMNTGIQDAANLGWKLAAVLHGHARDELLDTYQQERHPVGKAVLRSSGAIIRLAMVKSRLGQAVRGVIGGFALSRPGILRKVAGQVSGIGIHYGAQKRIEDIELTTGRLFEALRGGHFVLVTDEPAEVPDFVRVVKPVRPVAQPILVRPDGYVTTWDDVKCR
ncbi:2-polyprenyl-6-methoxyphenol hydroxylase-like FAD-dependent oxidoreductase [Kibdelosporangium banguiense]|uniref:2-polyprenyl-6-methoxyphenol hydroxylase-like FAD-dependent oxidoreductase n=1 Tax=Kibdelosporangium banguiense TaxID=1365924 RepID=A0ABS4T876_9PSEU|nr:FAD-dependent monooxygenase [Kibdelosporangium banguiense]MBP2320628.1 2-polyprenyl-6-methoxyphenol hydroxylase-like FAD-dependent oxidoreductase [Kibdelosporangium banguiense]